MYDTSSGLQKCKTLARSIKSHRSPGWPCPPTQDLPSKALADELVECYLRTTESIYRVLHVPTFRKNYESFWHSEVPRNIAFLMQLKLVLAIGAAFYDSTFTLRVMATRWLYEAQTWLSQPEFKSRLTFQTLQTSSLLLLARQSVGVNEELVFISAGALLRMAMYMGLHRDPVHLAKRTVFAAEMRRRLWNTILEIVVQSSIAEGASPLLSLVDFNTTAPANIDDEELMTEHPMSKSQLEATDVSVAIALRETFPVRLAITKFLNDLNSRGTYEETLKLDAELKSACIAMRDTLRALHSSTNASLAPFALHVVHFIKHRWLSALHVPFFGPSLQKSTYAYSRQTVMQTSLKMWCLVYPSTAVRATHPHSNENDLNGDDLERFTQNGSGFFRSATIQALFLLAIELKAQVLEEDGIGPIPVRHDLMSVLEETKTWALKCMQAGETNVKGYWTLCAVHAQIEGLLKGLKADDLSDHVVNAAKQAEETSLQILGGMAYQDDTQINNDMLHDPSPWKAGETLEDWDFAVRCQTLIIIPKSNANQMTDAFFDFTSMDPMSWAFNDDLANESLSY